jgi:mannosyltransferase OCH1-like enzyme
MKFKDAIFPRLNTIPDRDMVPTFVQGIGIPKVIHQTFYDRVLPPDLERNVQRLKELNPGWEYRFYDDSDIRSFITSNYPPVVWTYFCRIDDAYGAAKADLFRYLLMYKCGGVYLDIKSSSSKPFSASLKEDDCYLLSHWANGDDEQYPGFGRHDELVGLGRGEYQQWQIACAPGHPYLKAVIETVLCNIDKYNPAIHGTGRLGVLRVTGPIPYTLAINRIVDKYKSRLVNSQTDIGLEYSIYKHLSHAGIFKSHYSKLTDSVVHLDAVRKSFATLIYSMQRLKKTIARRLAVVR